MELNIKNLRNHSIQPLTAEQVPGNESHLRPDPTDVSKGVVATPATHCPAPAPPPVVEPEPVEEEEEGDVADLEEALAEAAEPEAESGQPAKSVVKSRAGSLTWAKAKYEPAAELRRKASLPGKATTGSMAQYLAVQSHATYRKRPWDARDSFFGDLYADPLCWPEDLLTYMKNAYLAGKPIADILHGISRSRKRSDKLSTFPPGKLGPLRIIDVYAVLYTCALVYIGEAFPGDPRYARSGLKEVREAIVDLDNPKYSEIPITLFPEIYRKFAAKKNFSVIQGELYKEYPELDDVQIRYTIKHQLSKAIRRRLFTMRSIQPDKTSPVEAGRAVLKSLRRSGLAFRHGEQVLCLMEWPSESDVPLSMLPSEVPLPLSYLVDGIASLAARLNEPAYDVLQHLRNIFVSYQADCRAAVPIQAGTLPSDYQR